MSLNAEERRRVEEQEQERERSRAAAQERQAAYDAHVLTRHEQYRERMESKVLGPLIDGINEVIGGAAAIALRWRYQDNRLGKPYGSTSGFVCIVDTKTDTALSVYMNPDTLRKRLEFTARILGADVKESAGND